MQLGRDRRQRRDLPLDGRGRHIVRDGPDRVAIEPQHLGRVLGRPDHRSGTHLRTDRDRLELELGHDAEVAATAAQTPEQLGLAIGGGGDEPTRGRHQIDRSQPVGGQPVSAGEPADTAAERLPGHPRACDHAGRHRETERLCLGVELTLEHTRLHPRRTADRVDPDATQPGQIDDHAVGRRMTRQAVAAAPDRDRHPRRPGKPHRRPYVVHTGTAQDHRRMTVDRTFQTLRSSS